MIKKIVDFLKKNKVKIILFSLVTIVLIVLYICGFKLFEMIYAGIVGFLFTIFGLDQYQKKENILKENKDKNEEIINDSDYSDFNPDGTIKPKPRKKR